MNYHKYGLGTVDGESTGNKRLEKFAFKPLKTVIEELGHTDRVIDIFKIDCEGKVFCPAAGIIKCL